ncbi:MAG: hypothetical protein K8S27_05005 [Candidatus Omnitrophica bacterium]|nr:hypothetical protein [Candidatus Omnitrophota bacterium]
MSQSFKKIIVILILVTGASLVYCGYLLFDQQKMQSAHTNLQQRLDDAEQREQEKVQEIVRLKNERDAQKEAKNKLDKKMKVNKKKTETLMKQVSGAQKEIDRWKEQLATITKERDHLTANMQRTIKEKIVEATAKLNSEMAERDSKIQQLKGKITNSSSTVIETVSQSTKSQKDGFAVVDREEHWAGVIRAKAALEVQIEQMKTVLSERSVEMVELRQQNSDLKIGLETFQVARADRIRDLKQKEDMIKLISLELARTKNAKKSGSEYINNLQKENKKLRKQVQSIMSSKGELEKKIYRLEQDKNKIQRSIVERENMIQGKINEIWDIKDSLDKTFRETQMSDKMSDGDGGVELPSITVKSSSGGKLFSEQTKHFRELSLTDSGSYNGRILSVNDDNNFVIIDIGKKKGIRIGDKMSVYREGDYLGSLEIIQVREDISAADIKDQRNTIDPGDLVR